MPSHVLRRALLPSLGVLAALALFDARRLRGQDQDAGAENVALAAAGAGAVLAPISPVTPTALLRVGPE